MQNRLFITSSMAPGHQHRYFSYFTMLVAACIINHETRNGIYLLQFMTFDFYDIILWLHLSNQKTGLIMNFFGISQFLYSTLDKTYKMDYHAKNQLSSFKIVNLVACQSLGSPARIFNIIGKSQRLYLPKTAKIERKHLENSNIFLNECNIYTRKVSESCTPITVQKMIILTKKCFWVEQG